MKTIFFYCILFQSCAIQHLHFARKTNRESAERNFQFFMQEYQILTGFNVIILTNIFLKGTCLIRPFNGILINSCVHAGVFRHLVILQSLSEWEEGQHRMQKGFDNSLYIQKQKEHILERISHFDGKLYLEFGDFCMNCAIRRRSFLRSAPVTLKRPKFVRTLASAMTWRFCA